MNLDWLSSGGPTKKLRLIDGEQVAWRECCVSARLQQEQVTCFQERLEVLRKNNPEPYRKIQSLTITTRTTRNMYQLAG